MSNSDSTGMRCEQANMCSVSPGLLGGYSTRRGFTLDYSAISLVTKFPLVIIQPSLCCFQVNEKASFIPSR